MTTPEQQLIALTAQVQSLAAELADSSVRLTQSELNVQLMNAELTNAPWRALAEAVAANGKGKSGKGSGHQGQHQGGLLGAITKIGRPQIFKGEVGMWLDWQIVFLTFIGTLVSEGPELMNQAAAVEFRSEIDAKLASMGVDQATLNEFKRELHLCPVLLTRAEPSNIVKNNTSVQDGLCSWWALDEPD